jgi:hypothetical protein
MAQQESDSFSFDQVLSLVHALGPEDRGRLYTHLQFRFWDEELRKVRQQLDEHRAAQGLPAASDQEVQQAADKMRSPEDWAELRHEIQKGLDQLERGEGVPAEKVFSKLRARNKTFTKKDKP